MPRTRSPGTFKPPRCCYPPLPPASPPPPALPRPPHVGGGVRARGRAPVGNECDEKTDGRRAALGTDCYRAPAAHHLISGSTDLRQPLSLTLSSIQSTVNSRLGPAGLATSSTAPVRGPGPGTLTFRPTPRYWVTGPRARPGSCWVLLVDHDGDGVALGAHLHGEAARDAVERAAQRVGQRREVLRLEGGRRRRHRRQEAGRRRAGAEPLRELLARHVLAAARAAGQREAGRPEQQARGRALGGGWGASLPHSLR